MNLNPRLPRARRDRVWWPVHTLCLLLAPTVLWTGCLLMKRTAAMPQLTMQAVTGTKPAGPDPAVLQQRLTRYADDAISRIARTVEEFMAGATNQTEVLTGARARLAHTRTLVGLVTSPNPNVAALDAVSMATLTRLGLETVVTHSPQGARYLPMLRTAETLETNAWLLISDVLKPAQQQELRAAIETWQKENPDPGDAIFARPQEFATGIRRKLETGSRSDSGFLSLLTLDPMSGLDPAVREVAQTRLFAERALFAAQHAPRLLRWEIELLTLQLTTQPEMQTLLSNSTSLAASADRASRTAELLPDRITSEREAILRELKNQEGQLRELSAELTQTLAAGEEMSTSLNTTLSTFDALMKRFGVGEPKPERAAHPNAKPFDILDYAKTAEEVAAMADQLQGVLQELNTTLDSPALDAQVERLNQVSAQTAAEARGVLTHAALLAAGLLVITFAGVLAVRKLPRRKE